MTKNETFFNKNPNNPTDEDDDQNYIKKDDAEQAEEKAEEVIKILKNSLIKPESNQQRNLDRETGGLEAKEKKEIHVTDVWDDRSEQVDRMGTNDPLSLANKKSLRLVQIKRKKQKEEEEGKKHPKHQMKTLKTGFGKNYDSSKQSGGFRQMIKARQDFSHENGGQGGGAWR